jgi:ABC-type uncharacterized transport system substrate-binding protein
MAVNWRRSYFEAALGMFLGGIIVAAPAQAHPHVWVVAKSELVLNADNAVTAVRHQWRFDDTFSSYAVQGLGKDGKLPVREDLAELAKTNVESLAEYQFFTGVKVNCAKLELGSPVDYWLDNVDGSLTLNFPLPAMKASSPSKVIGLEVYDPSYLVEFTFAETAPAVALTGGGRGCAVQIHRPNKPEPDPTS